MANAQRHGHVTVTVMDNASARVGRPPSISANLHGAVLPVNQPPTLSAIAAGSSIPENTPRPHSVTLTNITDGNNTGQVLSVSAISSNRRLIFNPSVTYTSPNTFGTVNIAPLAQPERHGDDHGHRDE